MSRNKIQRYAPNRIFLETLIGYTEASRCRTLDNFFEPKRESTSRNPLNEQISNFKGEKTMKQAKLESIHQKSIKPEEATFEEVKIQ